MLWIAGCAAEKIVIGTKLLQIKVWKIAYNIDEEFRRHYLLFTGSKNKARYVYRLYAIRCLWNPKYLMNNLTFLRIEIRTRWDAFLLDPDFSFISSTTANWPCSW